MSASGELFAQLLLRFAPQLAVLKRIPVAGSLLSWASTKAVARDSLVWTRVKRGRGAGLWLHLNPRTGRHILEGSNEAEVQSILAEHLRPGMVFYDLGANIGFFSLLAAKLVGKNGRVISSEVDPEPADRLKEVIRGARELLRKKRPVILCEVHSEENRSSLVAELASSAYECRPCDENHILALPR